MVRELQNCILTAVCEATFHVAEGGCTCTPCTPPKSAPAMYAYIGLVGRGPTIASADSWVSRVYPYLFHCAARFLQCLIDQPDCCVQAEGRNSRRSYSVRLSITRGFVECDKLVGEPPEHGDKLWKGYQYVCLPGLPWPTLTG